MIKKFWCILFHREKYIHYQLYTDRARLWDRRECRKCNLPRGPFNIVNVPFNQVTGIVKPKPWDWL